MKFQNTRDDLKKKKIPKISQKIFYIQKIMNEKKKK